MCNNKCGTCSYDDKDLGCFENIPERVISEEHLEEMVMGFVEQADYYQKLQILSLITNFLSYSD
jgi:hypothetical protein